MNLFQAKVHLSRNNKQQLWFNVHSAVKHQDRISIIGNYWIITAHLGRSYSYSSKIVLDISKSQSKNQKCLWLDGKSASISAKYSKLCFSEDILDQEDVLILVHSKRNISNLTCMFLKSKQAGKLVMFWVVLFVMCVWWWDLLCEWRWRLW